MLPTSSEHINYSHYFAKKQILKTVFSIGNNDSDAGSLLIELGENYCCYALLDKNSKSFQLIRYISFDEFESESNLGDLLNEWADKNFTNVVICSAYAQALLIPQNIFKPNDRLVTVIYDLPGQRQFSDDVPEWQIVNSYSIPSSIYDRILKQFPTVVFFSCLYTFIENL